MGSQGGIRRGLAPLLLVLVAIFQLWQVETRGLSRWKGGGFGMYADFPFDTRQAWYTFQQPGEPRRYVLKFEPSLFHPVHHIHELADKLPAGTGTDVRVECWVLDFDPATATATRSLHAIELEGSRYD